MQFLVHVLSLPLRGLKACHGAISGLDSLFDLLSQALILLPKGSGSLFNHKAGLNLSVHLLSGVLNPLLSHVDLLGNLHKGSGRIIKT